MEHQKSRKTLYLVFVRNSRVIANVDAPNDHVVCELGGKSLKNRFLKFALATPVRTEVDNDRSAGLY